MGKTINKIHAFSHPELLVVLVIIGIHAANVVQLADRIEQRAQLAASCKRKYVHGEVLSQGNYGSVIENGQKIRPKRPE